MGHNPITMPLDAEVEEAFQFFDSDAVDKMWNDVKATKKTTEEVETAFKVFDNRGGGYITNDSFSTMMKSVGEGLTEQEFQIAFEQAKKCSAGHGLEDVDGRPAVYYPAFLKWMMPEYQLPSQ